MRVPEGWEFKKLEDLASVERGKFSARPRNDPKYYGGQFPFVQTGDIAESKTYLIEYSQTLNDKGLAVSRLFPKNTILITIAANIGDTAITTFDVACPDSLVAVQANEDTDVFWLNSFLETKKEHLDSMATQNAQKNINLQVLRPLEILSPPYAEQQKIAQILSVWDKAITTTEQLLTNSQQQKKALMQQLLTGKKRLLDDKGQKFSGEWKYVKLGEMMVITTGTSKRSVIADDGQNFIIDMGSVSREGKLIPSKRTHLDSGFLKAGQLVMPKDDIGGGNIIGRVGLIAENDKYILADHVYALEVKNNDSCFIGYLINSYKVNKSLRRKANGTAQLGLGKKDVESQVLCVPKQIEEQQKIATVLTAADNEITQLQQKLDQLKQEKKALMQQLLTGKRRVKT